MSEPKRLSKAEFVILGLLLEGESHAYELEKSLDQREIRSWADVSMPSLYRLARKLGERGFLTSRDQATRGGPPRKLLSLTALGRRTILAEVRSVLSKAPLDRSLLWLALMFAAALPEEQTLAAIERMRARVGARVEELVAKRRAVAKRYPSVLVDAIFAHEIAVLRAEKRWAKELKERLRP